MPCAAQADELAALADDEGLDRGLLRGHLPVSRGLSIEHQFPMGMVLVSYCTGRSITSKAVRRQHRQVFDSSKGRPRCDDGTWWLREAGKKAARLATKQRRDRPAPGLFEDADFLLQRVDLADIWSGERF